MVREWGDRRLGGRLGPEQGQRRALAGTGKEPMLEFDPITVEALADPIRETEDATGPDDPGHLAEGKLGDRRVEVVAEGIEHVIEGPVGEREQLPSRQHPSDRSPLAATASPR